MSGVPNELPVVSNRELREMLLGYLRAVDAHFWPGIDGLTVDTALASYSQAAAAGLVPEKNKLLSCHPELATELEILFAEQERYHQLATCPSTTPAEVTGLRAD